MDKINWRGKNVWFVVSGVILVLFLVIGFYKSSDDNTAETPDLGLADVINNESSEAKDTSVKTTKATAPKLSYQDAVNKYANTRIQFDDACHATPTNMTYKSGTSIMLDNRAGVSRKIRVGSVYTVPAYDFKIVKVSSTVLPATWLVDCGTSQNVATILIQK